MVSERTLIIFWRLITSVDDESIPTIRCTSCSEWHHRPCVIALDVESPTFVCECCLVSVNWVSWNCVENIHSFFSWSGVQSKLGPLNRLIHWTPRHSQPLLTTTIYTLEFTTTLYPVISTILVMRRCTGSEALITMQHLAMLLVASKMVCFPISCGLGVPSLILMSVYTAPKKKYTANPLSTSDQRLAPTLYSSHQLIHTPSELADTYSSYHHQMAPNSQTPEPLIIFEHVSRTGSGGMFQSPLADASANEAGKQQQGTLYCHSEDREVNRSIDSPSLEFNNTFDLRSLDDVFGTPPHQAQPLPTEIPTPSCEADTQELWDYWEWYMLTPPSSPGSDAGENFVRDQPSPIPFRSIPSPDIFRTVPFPKIRSLNIVDLAEFEGG